MNLGAARAQLGDLAGAVGNFGAALDLYDAPHLGGRHEHDLGRAAMHMNRGNARGQLGDLAGAVADYGAALDLYDTPHLRARREFDLNRVNARTNMGNARLHLGNFAGAVADYEAVLALYDASHLRDRRQLDPSRAAIRINRSSARLQLGDLAGAVADYNAVLALYDAPHLRGRLELDCDRAMTRTNRGTARLRLGDVSRAVADYDAALDLYDTLHLRNHPKLGPDKARTRMNRGGARRRLGDLPGAMADYDAALDLFEAPNLRDRRELDLDRAKIHMNRGIARMDSGDLGGAVADLDAALILYDEPHLRDRRELDPDRAQTIMNRGAARGELGDLAGAVEDFEASLALYEAAHLRDRRELDPDRAQTIMNRGCSRLQLGDLAVAVEDFGAALALYEAPHLRDRLELQPERARIHMGRAIARTQLDDRTGAVHDFDAALALYDAPYLLDRHELDPSRAVTRMNRGIARDEFGDLAGAVADFGVALDLYDAPRLRDRCDLDPDRATTRTNRGNIWLRVGDFAGAVADYDVALGIYDAPHLRDRSDLDPNRAGAHINRGNARLQLGDVAGAVADCGAALDHYDTPHLRDRRELDGNRARTRMTRGNARLLLGDLAGAVADFRIGDSLYNDPSGIGFWHHLDRDRVKLWANIALALSAIEGAQSWAADKSRRMVEALELAPTAATDGLHDPWDEARADFARFHARWLTFCLERGELDRIPMILSAIQGRELAARILDELSAMESSGPLSPSVRAYQQLRLELRKLQAQISAMVGGAGPDGFDNSDGDARELFVDGSRIYDNGIGSRDIGISSRVIDEGRLQALEAKYRELHRKLPELRSAAAREPGYEALIPPRLDGATLVEGQSGVVRSGLSADEALVLFLDVEHGADIEGAVVLRHGREPAWCPLPGVRELALKVDAVSHRLGTSNSTRLGTGFRYAGARAGGADAASIQLENLERFWPQMKATMAERLWRPLKEALAGIARAICITQGKLHLLPLDLGVPQGLTLRHYPGLVFYGYRCGLLGRTKSKPVEDVESQAAIGLIGYGGVEDNIPFVRGEVDALKSLHGAGRRPVRIGDPYHGERNDGGHKETVVYALLHLACHGGSDVAGAGGRVALELGPGRRLDMGRIMESPVKAEQVLIAACVGGKVREALDGEPSGLVGGYLYSGTRQVAASVVALPDNWTMLASLLIHQAWLESGDLDQAVAEAKRRLEQGDWYNDTEALFVAAAAPVLAKWQLRQQLTTVLAWRDEDKWKMKIAPLMSGRRGPLPHRSSNRPRRPPSRHRRGYHPTHSAPAAAGNTPLRHQDFRGGRGMIPMRATRRWDFTYLRGSVVSSAVHFSRVERCLMPDLTDRQKSISSIESDTRLVR